MSTGKGYAVGTDNRPVLPGAGKFFDEIKMFYIFILMLHNYVHLLKFV